jgi:CheY-like chemotaxis protein
MRKVLLASDYLHFLKRCTTLLTTRGLGIYSTTRGAEAIRLHAEYRFDLIFTDFKLEDMSGCTLCSLVRKEEHCHHVPIVITCHNFLGSIERAEQSGASIVLIKPLEPIKLMETIGSFLGLQLGRNRRVVLEVSVFGKAEEIEFTCFSHDISNTGILLETEQLLDIGCKIVCHFTLPNLNRIETEGEVARCMTACGCNYLYGIKFVAMPLSHRKAIGSYITSWPHKTSNLLGNINYTDNILPDQPDHLLISP